RCGGRRWLRDLAGGAGLGRRRGADALRGQRQIPRGRRSGSEPRRVFYRAGAMNGQPLLRPAQRGFSLVEMLVALMIMAIVSVLAWAAFDGVLAMEARSKEQFLAENRLQLAVAVIHNDLLHLRQRPARDPIGGQVGAYLAPWREFSLVFTRGGVAAHRAP